MTRDTTPASAPAVGQQAPEVRGPLGHVVLVVSAGERAEVGQQPRELAMGEDAMRQLATILQVEPDELAAAFASGQTVERIRRRRRVCAATSAATTTGETSGEHAHRRDRRPYHLARPTFFIG